MTDPALSISPEDLIRFGFREDSAEAAAQDITELAEAIFGPLDPEVAEGWALSQAQDLGAAAMRQVLGEALKADDPLAALTGQRDVRSVLERCITPRWSSPRGRALGHPPSLQGQTWSSLSETAREEVRDALQHLRGFWASQIRRDRPKNEDLDTFLRELAEIFVIHSRQEGDRRARAAHGLRISIDVPHSPTSRFVRLAEQVLAQLPPLPSGEPRVSLLERTARGLSERWKRIKAHEATGGTALDEPDRGNPPT